VPNTPTSFIDELAASARGVAAIVVNNRSAPNYFDFTQRGLVGSFIVLLVAAAIDAYLPVLTGTADGGADQLAPSVVLLLTGVLFSLQAGVGALILRQMHRFDAFVPYLVAGNWASFFATIAANLLKLVGVSDGVGLIFFGLVLFVVEINTARLIMTLTTKQVVIFLVVQTLAVLMGLILVAGIFFPQPPAT
jgi:hypothetical protein